MKGSAAKQLRRLDPAALLAKAIDLSPNHVSHITCPSEFLPGATVKSGGIGKRPMQASSYAGENRATFRFRFTTDRDDVFKHLARFPNLEDRLSVVLRDIDAEFLKLPQPAD